MYNSFLGFTHHSQTKLEEHQHTLLCSHWSSKPSSYLQDPITSCPARSHADIAHFTSKLMAEPSCQVKFSNVLALHTQINKNLAAYWKVTTWQASLPWKCGNVLRECAFLLALKYLPEKRRIFVTKWDQCLYLYLSLLLELFVHHRKPNK